MRVAGQHQGGEDEGVSEIGDQVDGMESEREPYDRAISVVVPADVKMAKLVKTDRDRQEADARHDKKQLLHTGQVLLPSAVLGHLVGPEAGQQESGKDGAGPIAGWRG